jgi:hypothetical protein
MSPDPNTKRNDFGEPLASDMLDFRAANYNAQEIDVIRRACREHIDRRLAADDEMRRLFNQAREKRLAVEAALKENPPAPRPEVRRRPNASARSPKA